MSDINRVVLTGRLTRDPELKALPDGTPILAIRLAFSTRKRDAQGQWGDVSNYVDVSMFGQRAESLSRLLEKGRLIGVDGKLRWREWQTNEGEKRSAIDIAADSIELIGGRSDSSGERSYAAPEPAPGPGPVFDDDIPF
ncbi:MAG: single-stranded DNA-binding protein [Coriobacteriia bacterium]